MKNLIFIVCLSLLMFSCKKDNKTSPIIVEVLGPKILKVTTTLGIDGYYQIGERVADYYEDSLKSISVSNNLFKYQFNYSTDIITMNAFRIVPDYGLDSLGMLDFVISKKGNLIDKIDYKSVAYSYNVPMQWYNFYKEGKLDSTTLFSEDLEYYNQNIKNCLYVANELVEFDSYNSYSIPNRVKISYGAQEDDSKVNTLPYNNFLLSQYAYLYLSETSMLYNVSLSDYYLFQRELSVTGVKSDKLITAIFIENRDGTESDISYTIDYKRDEDGHISKMSIFKNGELYRVEEFEYE